MSNKELRSWPGKEKFGYVQKVRDKERPKTTWTEALTSTRVSGQDELLIAHGETGVNGQLDS